MPTLPTTEMLRYRPWVSPRVNAPRVTRSRWRCSTGPRKTLSAQPPTQAAWWLPCAALPSGTPNHSPSRSMTSQWFRSRRSPRVLHHHAAGLQGRHGTQGTQRVHSSHAPGLSHARGRPLGGLRVLDLTRILAGPVSGRCLAAQWRRRAAGQRPAPAQHRGHRRHPPWQAVGAGRSAHRRRPCPAAQPGAQRARVLAGLPARRAGWPWRQRRGAGAATSRHRRGDAVSLWRAWPLVRPTWLCFPGAGLDRLQPGRSAVRRGHPAPGPTGTGAGLRCRPSAGLRHPGHAMASGHVGWQLAAGRCR